MGKDDAAPSRVYAEGLALSVMARANDGVVKLTLKLPVKPGLARFGLNSPPVRELRGDCFALRDLAEP
jgi:hypothetical protein